MKKSAQSVTPEKAILLIEERLKTAAEGPIVILLDGRSSAGKTTLARALSERLHAPCAHTDDYLLPFSKRTDTRMSEPGGHLDYERFQTEILTPFFEKQPISYRPFDCHTDSYRTPELFLPAPLLLTEGAYACHPALTVPNAVKIFCDIDKEEQARRITAREGEKAERFFSLWIPKEEAYIAATHPEHRADLILMIT